MHITKYLWPLIAINLCLGKNHLPNMTPPLSKSHSHHRYPTKGNHHGEPTWGHVRNLHCARWEQVFGADFCYAFLAPSRSLRCSSVALLGLDWMFGKRKRSAPIKAPLEVRTVTVPYLSFLAHWCESVKCSLLVSHEMRSVVLVSQNECNEMIRMSPRFR